MVNPDLVHPQRRRIIGYVAATAVVVATCTAFAAPALAAVPTAEPNLTVTTPASITQGGASQTLTAAIDNTANGSVDHPNSRADFTLTGTGLKASDLTITYPAAGGQPGGTVPLTQAGANTVTGYYGPVGGFDIPVGYKATTTFTVTAAGVEPGLKPGNNALTVHTVLDDVSQNPAATFATATPDNNVTIIGPTEPNLTVTTPASITQGGASQTLTAAIDNTANGSVDHPNSRADFTLTGTGLKASDLTITYPAAGGQPGGTVPLTQAGANTVTGYYGPVGGFDIPVGYKATTTFTVTAAGVEPGLKPGNNALTVHTVLDDVSQNPAATFATATPDNNVTIIGPTEPKLTVTTPPSAGQGASPFTVTASIDNSASGSVDHPNSRADFTLTGKGLRVSDIMITYPIANSQPGVVPLTQAGPNTVTGYFGPVGGFDIPVGYMATTTFTDTLSGQSPGLNPGPLTLTTSLDDVSQSPVTTFQTTTNTVTVAVPSIAASGPPAVVVEGRIYQESIAITNGTGSDYTSLSPAIGIFATGIVPADVTIRYTDVTGTTGVNGTATLTGSNGVVVAQFPSTALANGATRNVALQVTFTPGQPPVALQTVFALNLTSNNAVIDNFGTVGPVASSLITTPGAPSITSVTAGNGQLTVNGVASTATGGSPITGYITTVAGGANILTVTSSMPGLVLTGLTNGTTYTITQQATNAAGNSPPSNAVSAVPVTQPLPGAYKISISSKNTFVTYLSRATYTGVLTAGGIPVPNTRVVVTERFVDNKTITLGSATTNAQGVYSFTFGTTYSGTVIATAQGATASAPSRVIVTYRSIVSKHSGSTLSVVAQTRPGFVTGTNRQERVQLLEVDSHGRQIKVLGISNAAQRVGAPGEKHGINVVSFSNSLAPGTYRLEVKVIGTPVNTGAASRPFTITIG